MSLRDFEQVRVPILYRGKPLISVRGLSLSDVSSLVAVHLDDLRQLAKLLEGAQAEVFATFQQDGFLLKLVTEVPSIANEIIARGADEIEHIAMVGKLPMGVQAQALSEIVRLTVEDAGGPKEFAALVRKLVNN